MPARPARLTKIVFSVLALTALGTTTGCETALTDPNPVTQPVTPPPANDIISNFDDNTAQGWTLRGIGSGPNVHPTLYHSGAHSIYANGRDNWFKAPRNFLGDLSAYYGAELSYWYLWSNPSARQLARDAQPDIEITGVNGQRLVLRHLEGPSPIVREWRFYSVRLEANAGWVRANDGAPATLEDIEGVLRNVGELVFRASRRATSGDNNYIDEVRLQAKGGSLHSDGRP
jgi:hypothetical protein